MLRRIILTSLLLILAALLILPLLGFGDVYQVSEGREGVVVHAIRNSGDYILPLRHAELVPSKPPLFHWLGALFASFRGQYGTFELRLPSAVGALGIILVTFLFVEQISGLTAAFLSSAILLSTNGFVRMAADGRVDMLFCFFVTAAIFRWLDAYFRSAEAGLEAAEPSTGAYRDTALLCGCAVLTKGPLGLLLPILFFSIFLAVDRGPRAVRSLFRIQWAWALLISVPWYIAAALQGSSAFLNRQLMFENVRRFFGGQGISVKPWWFYLEQFWLHAAPWSFVFAFCFVLFVKDLGRKDKENTVHLLQPEKPAARKTLRASLLWMAVFFLFFSAAAGKRSAYLLMLLPPLSVFLSVLVIDSPLRRRIFSDEAGRKRWEHRIFIGGVLLWLLLALFGALLLLLFLVDPAWLFNRLPKVALHLTALKDALAGWTGIFICYFSLLFVMTGVTGYFAHSRRSLRIAAAAFFFLSQLFFIVFGNAMVGMKGKTHGYHDFARAVAAVVPENETLTFIKKKRDESFDGFFFYVRRNVLLYEPSGALDGTGLPSANGWYLARKGWLNEQPDAWTARVHRILDGGRRVDSEEKKVVLFRLEDATTPLPERPVADESAAAPEKPSPTE
jgi:4-amino-4-deoxy-L-arabinose transferase-like glycosyltransferase